MDNQQETKLFINKFIYKIKVGSSETIRKAPFIKSLVLVILNIKG